MRPVAAALFLVAASAAAGDRSVREARPISVSGTVLGKAPFAGAQADINLIPYLGLGIGYGAFSLGGVSGGFVPLFLHAYPLTGAISPYLVAGLDFVTVSFSSSDTLLNSTFSGTQAIVGAGVEGRFEFGLLVRAEIVRFLGAAIFVPGLAVGYSFPEP